MCFDEPSRFALRNNLHLHCTDAGGSRGCKLDHMDDVIRYLTMLRNTNQASKLPERSS